MTVETWKEAMQHAEGLAKTAERKASAQRSHYMRRVAKMGVTLTLTRTLTLTPSQTRYLKLNLNLTLLQEEADILRMNVEQAELQLKKLGHETKKIERCADVAKKMCQEKVANADREAKSHARRSDIKRRNYERHVNVLQVRLALYLSLP